MKTPMSRFQIHDDLTAPEGSLPVLKGALAAAGQLPNFLGVLAGSPAALRGYARFRSELRHGALTLPTLERIALAVAVSVTELGVEPGALLVCRDVFVDGVLGSGHQLYDLRSSGGGTVPPLYSTGMPPSG